jgi:hypothetical protein
MSRAGISCGLAAAVLTAALAGCSSPSASPAQTPPSQPQAAPPAQQPGARETAPSSTQTGINAPQHPIELTDADIPPLPMTPFAPARPMEVVRAVYAFAARHPEVLSHVPCFCGCESRGHRHNDDCFVAARDPRGRPTAWEPHGVG